MSVKRVGREIGARNEHGVTLQSTSEGGRQIIGSKVNFRATLQSTSEGDRQWLGSKVNRIGATS